MVWDLDGIVMGWGEAEMHLKPIRHVFIVCRIIIVAPIAGDLISEIAVAMTAKMKLPALASVMHPYPSYGLSIQTLAAGVYYDNLKGSAQLYALLKRLGL